MGRVLLVITVLAFVATFAAVDATAAPKSNDHSFNWLRDADGDGIPNCLDNDWSPPRDGSGYQLMHGFGALFGFGPAWNGTQSQQQYRNRKGQPETPAGSQLGDRLRKRDGTCIQ